MAAGEPCGKLLSGKLRKKEFDMSRKKGSEADKGTSGDFIANKQVLSLK